MASRICFYAVRKGRNIGIFTTWSECEKQVKMFPGSSYKKFMCRTDAENFINPSASVVSGGKVSGGIHIYTDGACFGDYVSTGNGTSSAKAGIGIFYGENDPRNVSEPLPGDMGYATNQLAELYALHLALKKCFFDKSLDNELINIYTDSKYSIDCLTTWRKKWEKNGWRTVNGKPVKYQSLIRLSVYYLSMQNVQLHHVRGHQGVYGNEQADRLASLGAARYVSAEQNR